MTTPGARKSNLLVSEADGWIPLGRISGVHGLSGEVKLWLHNPASAWLLEPRVLKLRSPRGEERQVHIEARRGSGRRVRARIDGVQDRAQARALMGWELLVRRAALPPAEEGSWYHFDLLGKSVWTLDGRQLGRLTEIHQAGSVDVWQFEGDGGLFYFPVLLEFISQVGDERIIVDGAGVLQVDDGSAEGGRGAL